MLIRTDRRLWRTLYTFSRHTSGTDACFMVKFNLFPLCSFSEVLVSTLYLHKFRGKLQNCELWLMMSECWRSLLHFQGVHEVYLCSLCFYRLVFFCLFVFRPHQVTCLITFGCGSITVYAPGHYWHLVVFFNKLVLGVFYFLLISCFCWDEKKENSNCVQLKPNFICKFKRYPGRVFEQ